MHRITVIVAYFLHGLSVLFKLSFIAMPLIYNLKHDEWKPSKLTSFHFANDWKTTKKKKLKEKKMAIGIFDEQSHSSILPPRQTFHFCSKRKVTNIYKFLLKRNQKYQTVTILMALLRKTKHTVQQNHP
jgi:hypothetical protein